MVEQQPRKRNYNARIRARSETSARIINAPYPFDHDRSDYIDWKDPKYEIIPDDPRWVLPPILDVGASEWYQNQPQEEQIKIGMYRIAQMVKVGAQFEMALNMGIFSANMSMAKNFDLIRYSHHEAEEETRHIMMFMQLLEHMRPEMKRLGIEEVQGGPKWFKNIAPAVTLMSRVAPLGFWQLVLTGEEPIDRMQRSLIEYDKNLERQGVPEDQPDRIHPIIRKVMEVHIEEESRHIGFASDVLRRKLEITKEQQDAGEDRVGKLARAVLAGATPAMYYTGAKLIVKPSKKSLEDMGIPEDVAKETWFNSEHGQETWHGFFKNVVKRLDRYGLRDGEVKSKVGQFACRVFNIDEK